MSMSFHRRALGIREVPFLQRTIALPTAEQCQQMWASLDGAAAKALTVSEQKGSLLTAISNTVEDLKRSYQHDHVAYVTSRFIDYLRDEDKAH